MFSFCSHLFLMMFPRFSMGSLWCFPCSPCVPPWCSQSTSLYPISFAQNFPLLTYVGEPKGWHSILEQKLLFWGASQASHLFWWWAYKKNRTWEAAHLTTTRGDDYLRHFNTFLSEQFQGFHCKRWYVPKYFHQIL
jgi:hypothetical protein